MKYLINVNEWLVVFHPIFRGFLGKIKIKTNIFMGVRWTLCVFGEKGRRRHLKKGRLIVWDSSWNLLQEMTLEWRRGM
jgi:hypothetical protein